MIFDPVSAKDTSINAQQNNQEMAFNQLRGELLQFLKEKPHFSVNAMARKCESSETTLRRIRKGNIKTMPKVSTVIDILKFISKENDSKRLLERFPGPLADYLKEKIVALDPIESVDIESVDITNILRNSPSRYLIYKLAANNTGVTEDKIVELFGRFGLNEAEHLVTRKVLKKDGFTYRKIGNSFSLNNDVFIENFQATAQFIKPHKIEDAPADSKPFFINISRGVNIKTYRRILKIQRNALRQIRMLLASETSIGKIPLFFLSALDTIDSKAAYEYPENEL